MVQKSNVLFSLYCFMETNTDTKLMCKTFAFEMRLCRHTQNILWSYCITHQSVPEKMKKK